MKDAAITGCGQCGEQPESYPQSTEAGPQCKMGPEGKHEQKHLISQSVYLEVLWAGNSLVRKHK